MRTGRYCSTQLLIGPLLIDHLAGPRNCRGMVIKNVSGFRTLMELVAGGLGREVVEKAGGLQYIAAEMLKVRC